MPQRLQYLLLQIRNTDDLMRAHERKSFARVLDVSVENIQLFDLLTQDFQPAEYADIDIFLLGGSGHYSAAGEGASWLERALSSLRRLHASGKPVFASCWGFQAMARALGGRVTHDLEQAEIGTHHLTLTAAGMEDPVFGPLGKSFLGQMGHEDCVIELPPNCTLLASTERVKNQAYKFDNRPIYCTQFHPELNCDDLLERVRTYPKYIEKIAGMPVERFSELIRETKESEDILRRFVRLFCREN